MMKTSPERQQRAGRQRRLSPVEMFAATRRAHDMTHLSLPRDWGLSELVLGQIRGEGIQVGPIEFWSPDLQPYVSNAKSKLKESPMYAVKYDSAALSSLSLSSVDVYRIEPSGRRTYLLTCPAKHLARRDLSEEDLIRDRKQYESRVFSRVRDAVEAQQALETSRTAQQRLLASQRERDRAHWSATRGEEPFPVRGLVDPYEEPSGSSPRSKRKKVKDPPNTVDRPAGEESEAMDVNDFLGSAFDIVPRCDTGTEGGEG